MTCRKQSGGCGFEFCWLCRGDWKEHGAETGGYYACNKYDASGAKGEDAKAQELKTELETYMFYYHRYESHKNAMKVADEQIRNADKKANELLERFSVRPQDTKFLKEATEQLLNVSTNTDPFSISICHANFGTNNNLYRTAEYWSGLTSTATTWTNKRLPKRTCLSTCKKILRSTLTTCPNFTRCLWRSFKAITTSLSSGKKTSLTTLVSLTSSWTNLLKV